MAKILHIGKYYPPFAGGIEHFLADLLPLQQKNHTVMALVHDHHANLSRFFTSVAMDKNYPAIFRCPSYGRLLYAPISPQFPFWWRKIIQDFQPDLLHLHLPNTSAFWGLFFPTIRQIPTVIHWHSDVTSVHDDRLMLAYRLYRPFEQALLKQAKAIIATSTPYLQSSLALKQWQDKTQVIPLGIALDRLPKPTNHILQWATSNWDNHYPFRLLTVGRLSYYKGHDVLIRALAEIPQAQLNIVGEGEQRQTLTDLIQHLNLQNRVKLLGFIDEQQLAGLFSTCDVFCLPSLERTEAFGMVLLEAMRYQCAIVASAIPGAGVNWIIDHPHTGLLVPPNDVVALVQQLRMLWHNPNQKRSLALHAQQRFAQHLTIEAVALAIDRLYARVLS
ncbi:glycosyltransferase [Thioflexithrix psekupsensis]|uniref:Glycosyl transferase family 1 n=1 Tax=Thioflexithrix psekupsensis TaxID=1570016 RepID=A0A251X9S9_9GAMM|nr:glycosyltransferase [Thioflexithrix psekupsensis]OUD14554.1 glycosyl transferase family 1 [Thioflexithrix psekupsensis]